MKFKTFRKKASNFPDGFNNYSDATNIDDNKHIQGWINECLDVIKMEAKDKPDVETLHNDFKCGNILISIVANNNYDGTYLIYVNVSKRFLEFVEDNIKI